MRKGLTTAILYDIILISKRYRIDIAKQEEMKMGQNDKTDKKPVLIRLSPATYQALQKWADEEFRSVNGQVEYVLTQALNKRKRPLK